MDRLEDNLLVSRGNIRETEEGRWRGKTPLNLICVGFEELGHLRGNISEIFMPEGGRIPP